MRRVALTLVLAMLAGVGILAVPALAFDRAAPADPLPAQAQQEQVPVVEAPATWQMTAVAGADGWVVPTEPLPLRVNLRSDLLLVGRIDVAIGGATTSQAIEIPAGGVKDYFIEAGTPGQRRQLRVSLVSDVGAEETVLETLQVTLRVPANEIVVAAVGADAFESSIRSASPKPYDQNVELVRMTPADLGNLNSAISYLVLPATAMSDLSEDDVARVRDWVSDGGRLIAAATNASRIIDPAGGRAFSGVDAVAVSLGSGEVTALNDFDSVDADGWSALLRSVPQPGVVRVQEDGGQGSLVGAALSGRSASVPALPWLLLGILLFVVLVGPVNFIVLRGFGKPEWAWVTVPVLSAVFVAGFWTVGRAQLQPFTVTHTSVVVQSDNAATGQTAFVLQVESGGEHELGMRAGWSSQGESFPGASSGVTKTDEAGRAVIAYELEDLGVGTAQAKWTDGAVADVGFTLTPTDGGFEIKVQNRTDMAFDRWGVVVDGRGSISSEALPVGGEGTLSVRLNALRSNRYQPVIMEAVERRGFFGDDYFNEYQQVYPMTVIAEQLAPEIKENGIHFFGFTDDSGYTVDVNGATATTTGSTLLLTEVPDDGSFLAAKTSARPRLLGVEGSSSVEQYYEEIYAYGAEALFFHYVVPSGVAGGKIEPGFTSLSESSVYDWIVGDFVDFEWGDQLDFSRVTSPTGEVVIKAARDSEGRFFDESITLSRFNLTWG